MFLKDGEREVVVSVADKGQLPGLGRTRLARELFSGRFRPGQPLQIDRIAVEHGIDKESVLRAFAEFQALGIITLADDFSASVSLPDAKAMQESYEVRAALEEIAGRAAAATIGGGIVAIASEKFRERRLAWIGIADAIERAFKKNHIGDSSGQRAALSRT